MSSRFSGSAPGKERRDAREVELAALISEQEKDVQWGHRIDGRGLSLDFAFEDGGTLGDIVGYQSTGSGESAIRKVPRPQKWTRRAVVKHVRSWVREHGVPPSYDDWKSPNGRGVPNSTSVARLFGSFNAAIEEAGFAPCPRGGRKHDIQGTVCRPRMRNQRRTARLSSEDLAKAYVLYERAGLSIYELADRLWRQFDYPSAKACRTCLFVGFYAEGFRVRDRGEARMQLPPEQRRAMAAARRLTKAQRAEICARRGEPQAALAVEYGVSVSAISYHQRKQL